MLRQFAPALTNGMYESGVHSATAGGSKMAKVPNLAYRV